MSARQFRARKSVAPLVLSALALVGASCATEPEAPYYGIHFYPPAYSYVGRQHTPTATATSGLPVTLTLDASSTGCTFNGGVLSFDSLGTCVVNANQPGDATHPAAPQVQRSISIVPCPPMRAGLWTSPLGPYANVSVSGSTFYGTANLTALGFGVHPFAGTVNCEVASMTLNGSPILGWLSPDGSTLSSQYSGVDIVLNAPPELPAE